MNGNAAETSVADRVPPPPPKSCPKCGAAFQCRWTRSEWVYMEVPVDDYRLVPVHDLSACLKCKAKEAEERTVEQQVRNFVARTPVPPMTRCRVCGIGINAKLVVETRPGSINPMIDYAYFSGEKRVYGDDPTCAQCAAEARQADVERARAQQECDTRKRVELRAAKFRGSLPLEYRDAKIDCVPEPLRAQLLQWLDDQQRPWCLVLLGAVGVGKTYSAAALACEWARRGYTPDLPPARFVSVPVLIQELRDDALVAPEKRQHGDSGIPAVAWASSLTVLDDLGTQRNTDFAIERLYLVIDGRYARRLPTIVTTNLALGTIAERIDPRLASRLVAGVVLRLSGPDRRLNRRADGS